MPDLTQGPNSYVASNYRRALDSFSRFGTRKLAFYTIYVYGVSDAVIDSLDGGEETYDPEFPREWIEQPKNILEAVQRGVQLMAEPYAYGDWDWDNFGPDYNMVYITAVVAADTVQDQSGQNDDGYPDNQNSYTIASAIEAALGNEFTFDYVEVQRGLLRGDYIDQFGDYALNRNSPVSKARREAIINAKVAAGKISLKRKP